MRALPEVKYRSSGKILQKKAAEAVVTFGYDHRSVFFFMYRRDRGKKISLTTKDFEHDLAEGGNHSVRNWHHLRASCQEWYCPGLAGLARLIPQSKYLLKLK